MRQERCGRERGERGRQADTEERPGREPENDGEPVRTEAVTGAEKALEEGRRDIERHRSERERERVESRNKAASRYAWLMLLLLSKR